MNKFDNKHNLHKARIITTSIVTTVCTVAILGVSGVVRASIRKGRWRSIVLLHIAIAFMERDFVGIVVVTVTEITRL